MSGFKKILIGTTIATGVIGIVAYVRSLMRTSAQLESVATTNIHSFDQKGLTIRVDVQIKNPTSSTLKIKFPFVKVVSGTEPIGTSKVINTDITIPKNGEARISGIMINMPLKNMLRLSGGIFKLLTKKVPVPILVKTISTIDLGWIKMPYEKTDDNTLKPKA